MSSYYNDEIQKRIAVENVNQLDFFVSPTEDDNPHSAFAYAILPNLPYTIISDTLSVLGIDQTEDSEDMQLLDKNNEYMSLCDAVMSSQTASAIRFSKMGVSKLLEAGVEIPSLLTQKNRSFVVRHRTS